jgi:hypothetical protein
MKEVSETEENAEGNLHGDSHGTVGVAEDEDPLGLYDSPAFVLISELQALKPVCMACWPPSHLSPLPSMASTTLLLSL